MKALCVIFLGDGIAKQMNLRNYYVAGFLEVCSSLINKLLPDKKLIFKLMKALWVIFLGDITEIWMFFFVLHYLEIRALNIRDTQDTN